MKSIVRSLGLAGAMCAAAAFLASCAEPKVEAVQAPPSVSLPSRVVQAASVYEAYVDNAATITPDFADGTVVSAKLKQAAGYNAQQFQRGEVAYAAIVALQDPAFVAAVRAYTADPAVQTQVVAAIIKDPAYVVAIKGSDSAAGLVIAALDSQGTKLRAAGEKVRQAAYDVQRQSWSKATVPDRDARLAAVKTISATPALAAQEQTSRLQLASSGQQPLVLPGAPVPAPYTPAVLRGLAVAALAVLGQGTEANADIIWAMLEEPNQMLCLNLAKMNLNQCLAVSKPHYEDVFCLGVHIMMDTGTCVVKAAGAPKAAPAMIAAAAPATAAAPISTIPAPAKKQ